MATLLSLHIKSDNQIKVAEVLQKLSGISKMTEGPYPKELDNNILLDDKANPTYLAIGNVQNGWIAIQTNSFKKLHIWAEELSKELDTSVIQIMGQTVSDVYYFLMYENGNLRREIEIYHGDVDNIIDKGKKFSFEKRSLVPSDDDDYKNLFDRDTLEQYCKEFGFDLFSDESPSYYFILKNDTLGKTINEYADSYKNAKPWWKFW